LSHRKRAWIKKITNARCASKVAVDAKQDASQSGCQKLFKVKVAEVRTANMEGKLRRRGKFSGYRSDWKKAYVKLKAGEKVPEFAEI